VPRTPPSRCCGCRCGALRPRREPQDTKTLSVRSGAAQRASLGGQPRSCALPAAAGCPVRRPGRGCLPDDCRIGASTWVPLVTAAAGLVAGVAAGLVGTVLARRWAREDRAAAWQREDTLRWHADRLQVYTRTISALDDWDAEQRRAIERRQADPPSFDAADWERHHRAVGELLAQLRLMAPEQVTSRASRCRLVFGQLRLNHLDAEDADLARIYVDAYQIAQATRALVEAMRADLDLGDGQVAQLCAADWSGDRNSGRFPGHRRS
jgi:hypothetical protein